MLGLFGGTFDPIHIGHLRVALDVAEYLQLQQVRFIPSADPPHRAAPLVSAVQRAEMTKRAIAGESRFAFDGRELERDGPSYSVLTLESFRDEPGDQPPLCLIVGTDAFLGFPQWHRWQALMTLCNVAVMVRPGYHLHADAFPQGWLSRHRVEYDAWNPMQAAGQVIEVPVTQLDISATDIRARLKDGRDVRYLVTESVREFIIDKQLYVQGAE